jgi:sulfopyruvate decarboxylase TPP-binding subunit
MVQPSKTNYVAPTPLSAVLMIGALREAAISHVIVVPDTYQKTFLSAVSETSGLKLVTACTEDEAIGINAGLYATGHRPILSIQNNGLYACLNTLRGIALDGAVPTVMLIGQYGQAANVAPEDSSQRMVRMLEPTLAIWGIPVRRLWSNADLAGLPSDYAEAQSRRGPTALVIPLPTIA